MDNVKHVDPNDFKVVEFHNSTDFDFTPELGAMYDGRPLFVGSGETRQYPYHVGHRLAENLAKAVLLRGAPRTDAANNPTGAALWDDEALTKVKNSFLTELYTEEKPIAQSQTDILMQKVAELEKLVKDNKSENPTPTPVVASSAPTEYKDKQEVIVELEKRGITGFNPRATKASLEKLLN